jgi:hypothetical protein
MHRKLCLTLFLVLALLLAAVPFAMAQEETFGLSAEDFALLTSPNMDADSATFDYSVDLSVTGSPDGDVMVTLSGAGAFALDEAGNPVGSLTVTGTADASGESTPVNMEFRLVDNVIYFNMGDDSGWMGQSLDDAMSGLSSMAPIPVDPSDLMSGDMSENPEAMEAMGEMMTALSSLEPSEYVSITRLGDENNQAHFQVSVDLTGILSSDAFMQMMSSAGEMSGDESMAGMGAMFAMMFQNVSLTWDQFVDLAENRVRQGILDFAMSVNPAMMGASDTTSTTPVDVAFTLNISNIQYDPAVSVTAPEGATMLPSASE